MKLTILFLLLITSLYSESKVYMGLNYGIFSESFGDIDATSSSHITTVKIGYGDIKAYAVEFSFDYTQNNSKIFSSTNISSDGNKIGFNVSLLKSFDFNYLYPFIKVGFGTGSLAIDRALQSSLSYGSFQGSLGTYIPLSESFDIELGYELRHTSYESVNTIVTTTSYSSLVNIAYVGINYRY
ncbi:hypothetical protein MNB_SM-4-259 [hydrothermal vent metagenome]|uniref:Uncharacterized protein n=1 Tax=hydrothermal vent metagenome TaxID=652676 RepID=A0A1W1BQM1_9ZZZZ